MAGRGATFPGYPSHTTEANNAMKLLLSKIDGYAHVVRMASMGAFGHMQLINSSLGPLEYDPVHNLDESRARELLKGLGFHKLTKLSRKELDCLLMEFANPDYKALFNFESMFDPRTSVTPTKERYEKDTSTAAEDVGSSSSSSVTILDMDFTEDPNLQIPQETLVPTFGGVPASTSTISGAQTPGTSLAGAQTTPFFVSASTPGPFFGGAQTDPSGSSGDQRLGIHRLGYTEEQLD